MLDRVALNQTRLRTPGVTLDSKGVALGARGLVLLPSLDRLVSFLSLYTANSPLTDLLGSLKIELVRSKLGNREITLSLQASDSGRMDRVAEVARLAGGYVFTGTSRHFVQYRDAAAPFGYDVQQLGASNAQLSLNHTQFTQDYQVEKPIQLASLLLRLQPRLAPSSVTHDGPRWLCAEQGLGPALIQYFVRSGVEAEVGIAEWPPASEFDPAPIRRYLFKLDVLPSRMHQLMTDTPGVGVYVPNGEQCAVELGYEHPVNLRACPIFGRESLVLIRGNDSPLVVTKVPALGPVHAFARVSMNEDSERAKHASKPVHMAVDTVTVPLRIAPDANPWQRITATQVPAQQLGLLRQICYRLSNLHLQETSIAFTKFGAFLWRKQGIDAIPVGRFFRQLHPNLLVSAGYMPLPAVDAAVLHRAFDAPTDQRIFLAHDSAPIGVPMSAFIALEEALLDAQSWSGTTYETVAPVLQLDVPVVPLGDAGFRPMRDVD